MVGIGLFPFGMAYFQVRTVSFREGKYSIPMEHVEFEFAKIFFGCETSLLADAALSRP